MESVDGSTLKCKAIVIFRRKQNKSNFRENGKIRRWRSLIRRLWNSMVIYRWKNSENYK